MPTAAALAQTATLVGGFYAIHGLRRWPDMVGAVLGSVAAVLLATFLALAAPVPDGAQSVDAFDPAFGVLAQPD